MFKLAGFFAAVGLVAAAPASASCTHATDGTDSCGPELIHLLYVTASGAVYVQPSSSLTPAPTGFNCKPVAGAYLTLSPQAINFKPLYALLLSARLSGAPVTMVMDPLQPQCTISYVTM
jgi:hypothetical protein